MEVVHPPAVLSKVPDDEDGVDIEGVAQDNDYTGTEADDASASTRGEHS